MSITKKYYDVVLQKTQDETEEAQGVKKICEILRKLDISDERKKEIQEVSNTLPESYDHDNFKKRQLQKYSAHQFPEYKEREYRAALVEQAKNIRERTEEKYKVDLVYKNSQRLRLPRHLADEGETRRRHDIDTIVKSNKRKKPDVTDPSFRFPQHQGQTYPTDYRGELLISDQRPFISSRPNNVDQEKNCYQNFHDGQLDMEATLDRLLDLFTNLAYGKSHATNAFRQIVKNYFPHLLQTTKDMDDEQILEAILNEYAEFDPKRNLVRYIEQLDRTKGQTYRSAMTQLVKAIRQLEEYKRTTLYTTEKAIHNHPLVIKAYTEYAPVSIRGNLTERINHQNMYRDNVDFEDICGIVQRYERGMTSSEIDQEVNAKSTHVVQMVSNAEPTRTKNTMITGKNGQHSYSRSPSPRQKSSYEKQNSRGRNEERKQNPQGNKIRDQSQDIRTFKTPEGNYREYRTSNRDRAEDWSRNTSRERQGRQNGNYREWKPSDRAWPGNWDQNRQDDRQRRQSRDDRRYRTPDRRWSENQTTNRENRVQSKSPENRYYTRSTYNRSSQNSGESRGRSNERQNTNYRRNDSRERPARYYQEERAGNRQDGFRNRSRSQENWSRRQPYQDNRRRTQSPRDRDSTQNRSLRTESITERNQRQENTQRSRQQSPGYPRDQYNAHRGNDGKKYYRPNEMGTRPWTVNRDQRRYNRKFSQDGREYRQFFDSSPSRNSSPWRQFNNNAKASGRNDRTRSNSPTNNKNKYGTIQDGVYVTKEEGNDEEEIF